MKWIVLDMVVEGDGDGDGTFRIWSSRCTATSSGLTNSSSKCATCIHQQHAHSVANLVESSIVKKFTLIKIIHELHIVVCVLSQLRKGPTVRVLCMVSKEIKHSLDTDRCQSYGLEWTQNEVKMSANTICYRGECRSR
jgi:hypothetical protein